MHARASIHTPKTSHTQGITAIDADVRQPFLERVACRLASWLRHLDQQMAASKSRQSSEEWQAERAKISSEQLRFVKQMGSEQQRNFLKR